MRRQFLKGRRPGRAGAPVRRGRPARGSKIDPSLFIKKATPQIEQEEYIPSFEYGEIPVHPQLKANLLKKGYKLPTPIQDQAIPHILEGRDILGIANTGTGKTAAFLVPLLHRAISDPKMKVLILAPTRELAVQIQDEFNALAKELRIWSILVVGGLSMHRQISGLRGNTRFLIATPGRLNDLKDRKAVNLATYTHLVLDEADRMVDMGFINDIRKILSGLPEKRHSLFFSATLPNEVKSLIHSFLKDPVTVSVKKQDTSANVEQDVIRVRFGESKIDILVDLLKNDATLSKVLIFGRTKRGVDRIALALEARDFSVVSIHGDKVQNKRQKALDLFKQNKAQILVATDVAARGLDIPNVSHVINFDVPQSYEDYVHRIGRTGRADKQGKALTFLE